MERREGGVGRYPVGLRVRSVEDRARRGGRAGEPALARLGVGERGLEELADDAERELTLELAAPRAEHTHVVPAGLGAELGEQPALPDARGPLDEREPADPLDGVPQGVMKRRDLAVALEKQLGQSDVAQPGTS